MPYRKHSAFITFISINGKTLIPSIFNLYELCPFISSAFSTAFPSSFSLISYITYTFSSPFSNHYSPTSSTLCFLFFSFQKKKIIINHEGGCCLFACCFGWKQNPFCSTYQHHSCLWFFLFFLLSSCSLVCFCSSYTLKKLV